MARDGHNGLPKREVAVQSANKPQEQVQPIFFGGGMPGLVPLLVVEGEPHWEEERLDIGEVNPLLVCPVG